MPQLTVNLGDVADCVQAIEFLKQHLGHDCGKPDPRPGPGGRGRRDRHEDGIVSELPLPQKLKRIQSRGMWKHLVKLAESATEPLSLPELDTLLELPKNKMRSLKAIMAKLENRFDLQFLKVDSDAGVDESNNPRYVMPPNVRRHIKRLAKTSGTTPDRC